MKFFVTLLYLVFFGAFSLHTYASEVTSGVMRIEHPWARASIGPSRSGVVYFTLVNNGQTPDRLIAVSTPVAAHAGMHTHKMQDNVMRMRSVNLVEVLPGETTTFKPGGLHVMLMGMIEPLREGTHFPLILEFEITGKIEITVQVVKATATVPASVLVNKPHKHGVSQLK